MDDLWISALVELMPGILDDMIEQIQIGHEEKVDNMAVFHVSTFIFQRQHRWWFSLDKSEGPVPFFTET